MAAFLAAVEKNGVCAELKAKTPAETVKLLCSGASRRGCSLRPENARLLLEQCGEGLYQLLGELDKLCALALESGEGEVKEITREMIETAATKNLEASVFDLSKALLQGQYDRLTACWIICFSSGKNRWRFWGCSFPLMRISIVLRRRLPRVNRPSP